MLYSIIIVLWAIGLLAVIYSYQKWTSYRAFRAAAVQHGCKRPPKYPHRDPFFGTDLVKERRIASEAGRLLSSQAKYFERCGKTYEEKFFDVTIINTMEARNIQQVTALGFHDWAKANLISSAPMFGKGILFQDGAAWKHSRDIVKPTFSRAELSDVDFFGYHVDRFLEGIPLDGTTVDLQLPLHKLFLDAATEFIFGQSMDSQLPDDPNDSAGFLKAMTDGFIEIGKRRNVGRIAPIVFFFDKKWKNSYDKLHSYIDVYVKHALEVTSPESEDKTADVDDNKPLDDKKPTRYILANEMAKKIRDPISLRFQILNVFIAARNTTSILMANALFHLARHPHIWTELREQSLALGSQPLTFELLKSLQLFKHVIWETVRLTGPSGRLQRRAVKNTILPVGGGEDGKAPIWVEKGTVVSMDLYSLHHDKDIWGEDPGEFNPHRWVGKRPMWEFVPFLGGPRMCPAQQQVLTQSAYLLVRMTRWAGRIENRDSCWEYVEVPKSVAESRNGVKVAFFSE